MAPRYFGAVAYNKGVMNEGLDGSRSCGVVRAHYCRWCRALVYAYAQLPFLSPVALLHMLTRTTVGVVCFVCFVLQTSNPVPGRTAER